MEEQTYSRVGASHWSTQSQMEIFVFRRETVGMFVKQILLAVTQYQWQQNKFSSNKGGQRASRH